jgi:hypothetical protein
VRPVDLFQVKIWNLETNLTVLPKHENEADEKELL